MAGIMTPRSAAGPDNNATGERSEPVALPDQPRRQQRTLCLLRLLTLRVQLDGTRANCDHWLIDARATFTRPYARGSGVAGYCGGN